MDIREAEERIEVLEDKVKELERLVAEVWGEKFATARDIEG